MKITEEMRSAVKDVVIINQPRIEDAFDSAVEMIKLTVLNDLKKAGVVIELYEDLEEELNTDFEGLGAVLRLGIVFAMVKPSEMKEIGEKISGAETETEPEEVHVQA